MHITFPADFDIATLWALRSRAVGIVCATHYPASDVSIWAASPPPAAYSRFLADRTVAVAEDGEKLVGYAALDAPAREIDAVFVDPAHIGEGVGKRLIQALFALARRRQIDELTVCAALNAVGFYRAAGFGEEREDLYAHPSGIALPHVHMRARIAV
ncbi:GNAT family N-acetyltransferase [Robbsia sp. Bb-Pol-6]|uniref:GNAT family N-acetyltransferase n=1 Tax=Robbsia betulipollinis TaxID=2981849 RepID=A0ABT3ZIC5_9BURK|nr:GNAT family N-acetyltransferase [Robbsia betulipollinis]MCY0386275.1 GNAT family N-acetyltransferase [Robbsia betulipollinis]